MMKISLLIFTTFISLATFIGTASAVSLPAPECGFDAGDTCLVFDDFTVYSMSFLQYASDQSLQPVSGDPYYIDSSPGKLHDDIVIGTGAGGIVLTNTDVATNVDNSYETPNVQGGQTPSTLFAMMEPDPDITWSGDNVQKPYTLLPNPDGLDINGDGTAEGSLNGLLPLWDISVADLTTFLDGDDLAIFFNLNDTNAGDGLDSGQDLLAWMTVYLTDSEDPTTSVSFTLSGNNTFNPAIPLTGTQIQAQTAGVDNILPDPDPVTGDLWAYVHGQICVDSTTGGVLALGSCSQNGNPANGVNVNQALGANAAAFALWNEDLNTALYSGTYDTLSIDGRLARIDNGYEQLFIRAAQVGGPVIPEPSTLLLLGCGIAGLAFTVRRRRKE